MQTGDTSSVRQTTALRSAAPPLQSLLRRVIAQSGAETPVADAKSGGNTEQVIVDTEVDGVRYLLLRSHPPAMAVSLSPREREIARMIAKGLPNKAIADVLEISPWTVCTHLRRMFMKLGVSSRAAMVARLLQDGTFSGNAR